MEHCNIFQQFRGFLDTPDIFTGNPSWDFLSFQFPQVQITEDLLKDLEKLDHPRNSVLGKRMESFFEIAIQHSERYELLASNIQIIADKRTLGELDFLIMDKESSRPLHVELVYKIYVFDAEFPPGNERWIGPNRKDSFPEKTSKLKKRQFPLLFKEETETYLSKLGINSAEVEQRLCFKAQLYLPNAETKAEPGVNPECVRGNWFSFSQFKEMDWQENEFFCPKKKFWTCDPEYNSDWMGYSGFLQEVENLFDRKKSPLVWMKTKTSYLRFFIVWW
ncbi:hypothetical protein GCM10023115_53160 [Pontixanthobacter gangjinensis]|uniref:DUF1853 family protein n=1 Tax=Christiangramia aestuarii TaxID=1028746 RepID=A0A7K1LQ67_9FLAO|nr:DUF1853 family protein [Christiangramia aestuarii]MUP42898.1 DUF1853 family protein [Christiangramia aestuarii]